MAEPRAVTRQEQILAEAQKRLDRIEKMREQMLQQVELEMQRLDEMRTVQEDFTQGSGTEPPLSDASPATFQSQFDQFSTTKSNERLKPVGNEGVIDFTGKLDPPKDDTPFYSTGDRDQHWTHLVENPGKPVYVSGRYVSSEHGTHAITASKEYEYELSVRALPVSVGDTLRVPVHPTGHSDGRAFSTGHLKLQVTDIYTKAKFHPYHDRIEG